MFEKQKCEKHERIIVWTPKDGDHSVQGKIAHRRHQTKIPASGLTSWLSGPLNMCITVAPAGPTQEFQLGT